MIDLQKSCPRCGKSGTNRWLEDHMLDEHGMTSQEVEDSLYPVLRVDKEISRLKFENENLKKLMSKFSNATFTVYLRMLEEPNRVWCSKDFYEMFLGSTIFRVLNTLIEIGLIKIIGKKRKGNSIGVFPRGGPNLFQYKLKGME